jgi:metal-responsive CopG/Arc/MetJ family transcriptional regulator
MEIISISIDRDTLDELDHIQDKLGFKSRSRLLRATINSLLNEYRVLEGMKGHCDVVFTVAHRHHEGEWLSRIMKNFEDVIRTEVHQHHAGTCLRILIACGEAERMRMLFTSLKKEKGAQSVNCSILQPAETF